MRGSFSYHRPRTVAEATALRAELEGSAYLAGGTDLLVAMKRSCTEHPRALVSLRAVTELDGIEVAGDGALAIGAGTRLADIAAHPDIRRHHPLLAQAAGSVGSVQIRNVATVGGNLCHASPCASSGPPLVVLDARLELAAAGGRRQLAIGEFFTGPGTTRLAPGELLARIHLAPPAAGRRSTFLRAGRVAIDLAIASVAAVVELEADGATCRRAQLAAGAVAPVPLPLARTQALLTGQRLDPDVLARAAELAREEIAPITDIRASRDYRRHLTGVLVERALRALVASPGEDEA